MKTKILILFIAIAPLAARAQFTFTTSSGVITITGYNPAAGLNVVIPDSTNGYPVTAIETNAFYFLTTITNVTIPASVTNIGDSAFAGCRGLTSVTFGNSVTSIGDSAFINCLSLTSITIPNSVTSIGDGAFGFCNGLTSVTIPNSVTNLGSAPFEGCPLTSIAVDAANPSYASLGGVLFDRALATLIECPEGLAGSYVVTNSVTSIGESAFGICDGLTNIAVNATNSYYASVAGVLFDKSLDTLLQFPGGLAGSYAIPNSVTSIGEAAFEDCPGLTSVTIPDSVTSIGGFAFNDCRRLTSVTIGNRVTSIGDEAFSHASLTSVTIPNSVTNIGEAAFEYCTSLQAYFQGNAPLVDGAAGSTDSTVFLRDSGTAYHLPGATGWGSTFGGLHTALWYQPAPVILGGSGLGVQGNQFGFTISWATNASVVVQAATNLANPVWIPVSTNTLTGGTSHFSDPQWTNYPGRFYRVQLSH